MVNSRANAIPGMGARQVCCLLLQDCQWQVLVMVLMKGLSLKRVFSLQDTFESRSGLTALKTILDGQEFTEEMFDALLEVLMEG